MEFLYYPGCTLRTKARNLDETTVAIANALGVKLLELSNWTCCGSVFPLVSDNLMNLVAPVRNLLYAKREGKNLVTVCSFCYNVLKRTNITIKDEEKLKKINEFIGEEKYDGSVKIFHFLEILKDVVGFKTLKEKTKKNLVNLRVAPFYGCFLVRPKEIGIDNPEDPKILDDLLKTLGCDVVYFPYKTECCGSYLAITSLDTVVERSYNILSSAIENGAEVVVVSCPLCHHNLDKMQENIVKKYKNFKKIPILYFTQILAIALGLDVCNFESNFVNPMQLIKSKNLVD